MENNSKKATFLERLLAFFIDIILVAFAASFLSYPFMINSSTADNSKKISDEMSELFEAFSNDEISVDTYVTESITLTYESAKNEGVYSLILIFLYIMYFIVFQFYNKGQTLGKKLLKIKVVSNTGDLSMNQMIIRSLLINLILLNMILMIILSFANDPATYFYGSAIFEFIQYLFIIISAIMIMFSKNRKGLHDYIVKTDVLKA